MQAGLRLKDAAELERKGSDREKKPPDQRADSGNTVSQKHPAVHLPPRALGAIERRPITQLVLPPPSSLIENHLCGRNAGTESRSSLITERRASSLSVCHTAVSGVTCGGR